MIKFIGEYSAKLDDKGRVVFPSAFKSLMVGSTAAGKSGPTTAGKAESAGAEEAVDMRFVVKKSLWEPCLEMYTFAEWERESEGIKSKINFLNRGQAAFWREYTRHRAVVEPEPKLGRMSIPKTLLESIGAGKELVFCGSDHKIEIWGKEQFDNSALTQDEFISLAETLSEK